MGSVFCCFRSEDFEDISNVNNGNRGTFINSILNTYAVVFQREQTHDVSSRIQELASSTSSVAPLPDNKEIGTELLKKEEKSNRSYNEGKIFPKSWLKVSSEKNESKQAHVDWSLEDEDVCPTCLEEYTQENPKITAKCSHHYHLGCIYEWMERSQTCPVCGKVMVFNESG